MTEQAHAAIDYYQMLERIGGGQKQTQAFARLFVVPGMNHCSGGDGAFAVDWFSAMERWAGDGQAPDSLVGAHVPDWETGGAGIDAGITAPAGGMTVTFTRPVYPFPLHAVFDGSGDAKDARNFHAVEGR